MVSYNPCSCSRDSRFHVVSKEKTMNIDDGSFADENIENIELISRDSEEGYARQNFSGFRNKPDY